MAYRTKKSRSKKPRYNELQRLAFNMGKVQLGLSNPDSLITESYERGLKKKERKPRKTLF